MSMGLYGHPFAPSEPSSSTSTASRSATETPSSTEAPFISRGPESFIKQETQKCIKTNNMKNTLHIFHTKLEDKGFIKRAKTVIYKFGKFLKASYAEKKLYFEILQFKMDFYLNIL